MYFIFKYGKYGDWVGVGWKPQMKYFGSYNSVCRLPKVPFSLLTGVIGILSRRDVINLLTIAIMASVKIPTKHRSAYFDK